MPSSLQPTLISVSANIRYKSRIWKYQSAPSRQLLVGDPAFPKHEHECPEVFWVEKGEMLHKVNGHEEILRQGDCVLIRVGDVHSLHSARANEPFQIVNFIFDRDVLEHLRKQYFQNNPVLYSDNSKLPRVVRLEEEARQRMNLNLDTLYQYATWRFATEHFLMSLFIETGLLQQEENPLPKEAPRWLHLAWEIYHASPVYFCKGPSEFYQLCGRSDEHASREFHRHTGITLQEYTRSLKLRYATKLLEGTSIDITEVAAEAGFGDLSWFHTAFKKQYQMTPKQYRQSLRETQNIK